MALKKQNYDFVELLLKTESGIIVTPDKMYLLETRLSPVAQRHQFEHIDQMLERLKLVPDKALQKDIIEAMTTNETSFFRDSSPFDKFKNVMMPFYIKNRPNKHLRIWSAACSSGQEAYSLCMVIKEMGLLNQGWKFDIIGTDLSTDILEQAKRATYTQFEVQRGLPIQMLVKYFSQDGTNWKLKDEIKNMVDFKPLNLLHDFKHLGQFDIVFCRNVLIYFDVPTKGKILSNIAAQMKQDGVLMLGGAETVLGISDAFKIMTGERGLYLKPDSTFKPAG
jgi:chemotaxis protein methyltransferase CheR